MTKLTNFLKMIYQNLFFSLISHRDLPRVGKVDIFKGISIHDIPNLVMQVVFGKFHLTNWNLLIKTGRKVPRMRHFSFLQLKE